MANDKLVGTWKLLSASSTTSAGERSETPYGPGPAGFLTYTQDGRISTVISYGGRKPISFGREGAALDGEEQAEAFRTFLAYAGRYTLDDDNVTHHVEVSSIPNYVNRDLVRNVKFEGDRIMLITPPTPVNGKIQTIELIWQRVPAGAGSRTLRIISSAPTKSPTGSSAPGIQTRSPLRCRTGELHLWKTLYQIHERDLAFQSRELVSDTKMGSGAERQVLIVQPFQV